ncbi:ParA family protein [Zooshikella marina]|uniref:ParA family protein n=1 Tax=Zooshikella ganghwensis TaxID=202772 RepID=UPI001BB02DD6|nr:ParA family protein [Zooshikella ganghwensis]MBU2708855.1 ParA family protein [Zooshikella ganghwensis]
MGKILAIANQKGGVGKTTLAVNVGKPLASLGYKTLLIDNDPQGNLTLATLGQKDNIESATLSLYKGEVVTPVEVSENLHFIGANINLAAVSDMEFMCIYEFSGMVKDLAEFYDYVLIDCLPSFGYHLSAAFAAADKILVPIKLSEFSVSGLKDLIEAMEKIQKHINPNIDILGLVANAVENPKTNFEKIVEEKLYTDYPGALFSTQVNRSIKVEESHAFYQSVSEYLPKTKQAEQFKHVTEELIGRLNQ